MNAPKQHNLVKNGERKLASEAYRTLKQIANQEAKDGLKLVLTAKGKEVTLPDTALQLLIDGLKLIANGKLVTIAPEANEITTQAAADLLGCSRPFLVKLLEQGKIPFVKIGRHRRVRFEAVMEYQKTLKKAQRKHLIEIMKTDEDLGLYDT